MDPIASLSQEAELDSSGRFSIDFRAARNRWKAEALKDPAAFLRLSLQALLARNPERLEVSTNSKRCRLRWTEAPFSEDEFASLASYFQGQADITSTPSMQLLKIAGMMLAWRTDIKTRFITEAQVLTLDPVKGALLEPFPSEPPGIEFQRSGPRPQDGARAELDLLRPRTSLSWPEVSSLKKGFGGTTTTLTWDGSAARSDLLSPGWSMPLGLYELCRCAIVHPDPARNRLSLRWKNKTAPLGLLVPTLFSCISTDGQPLAVRAGESVSCCAAALLYNGPLVSRDGPDLYLCRLQKFGWPVHRPYRPPKNMRTLVDASDLPTDITGAKLLRSGEERRLEETWRWLTQALRHAENQISEQPSWKQLLLRPHKQQISGVCAELKDRWRP